MLTYMDLMPGGTFKLLFARTIWQANDSCSTRITQSFALVPEGADGRIVCASSFLYKFSIGLLFWVSSCCTLASCSSVIVTYLTR